MLECVHEQKADGVQLIGVANCLQRSWAGEEYNNIIIIYSLT